MEGVYAFDAYLPWINEVADPTPERGVASYNFCTYTDDFREGDLVTQAQQTQHFNSWVKLLYLLLLIRTQRVHPH